MDYLSEARLPLAVVSGALMMLACEQGSTRSRDASIVADTGRWDADAVDAGDAGNGHDSAMKARHDAQPPVDAQAQVDAKAEMTLDGAMCKSVLLHEFNDTRGCLLGGRMSLEPCAHHAYGEGAVGGSRSSYYCLVSPDGTLYVTRDMSTDMDLAAPGWTRSSEEITTLFRDTLSDVDTLRCERAMPGWETDVPVGGTCP